ncbi:MAG: phosphoglucosamine mutase [Thermosediminibacterales bacterium]|nr:phosphoglucosamine mutase [Thermosediminibacterales bacterium]
MTERLFGTDGVRGVANKQLTPQLAFELGRAGAYIISGKESSKIVVGRDTRISGDMLEAALAAGICSVGGEVISVGVVPTPAVAYLTRHYGADAGAVISASHNPVEYNGIKFFDSSGFKLSDKIEDKIEKALKGDFPAPTGEKVGRISRVDKALDNYIDFLKSSVDVDFSGMKIALDCANGAVYEAAPRVLQELGADVKVIYNTPDGCNINVNCGSTHPDAIREFTLKEKADVGLAFDGDADRLIPVDEKGNILTGDYVMAICGIFLKQEGKLAKNTVVSTVMSNMGLDFALKKAGCGIEKVKVGDRYVLEEMLQKGYTFGGEQSGHIIFLEHNTTGDGLLTALQLLSIMKKQNKPLSELASIMTVFPQVLVNVRVADKNRLRENKNIQDAIASAEELLGDEGRILVRPSGTEPLIRVMAEGRDKSLLDKIVNNVAYVIEKECN